MSLKDIDLAKPAWRSRCEGVVLGPATGAEESERLGRSSDDLTLGVVEGDSEIDSGTDPERYVGGGTYGAPGLTGTGAGIFCSSGFFPEVPTTSLIALRSKPAKVGRSELDPFASVISPVGVPGTERFS